MKDKLVYLYRVHWTAPTGKSGYGEPMDKDAAIYAADEGNNRHPSIRRWIAPAGLIVIPNQDTSEHTECGIGDIMIEAKRAE